MITEEVSLDSVVASSVVVSLVVASSAVSVDAAEGEKKFSAPTSVFVASSFSWSVSLISSSRLAGAEGRGEEGRG